MKTVHEVSSLLTWRDVASKPGWFVAVMNLAFEPVALRALPGIEALKVSEEVRGDTMISFETLPGQDLRHQITKLFVEQEISLLEIQQLQLSLEDIFLGLLKEGKLGRRFP